MTEPTTPDALRPGELTWQLKALGVRPGDTLLVHTSLRAVGPVSGGARAVVDSLLEALGAEGTLVVYTQTPGNSDPSRWAVTRGGAVPPAQWPRLRATLPAFDPARTPSQGVGVLPEEVRTRPGALRSDHPQSSFAALGPAAARITAGHDLNCHLGEESPLARLEELDARVLLLGVDYSACTAFHLAEYRVPGQGSRDYGCAVDDGSGRRWHRYRDVDFDTSDFPALGEAYESRAERPVTRGRIGAADSRLFDLAPAVAYAAKWLTAHRAGRRPTE
ncbi:AAC(3) family N-acetyltransferase [Streptomyces griseorubiginosus]|uniref:aminoglycoside N(3)-acetyltransferase n=1 Tax=Streptomyces griseorubiginosus TaxID=67304 RepID=UPI002E81A643|nr:AAC(3) family N-acetyltransferase [Streptomyces griseorubiginosus]WUB45874.1 AAC(3) family N-acetyltransferase [Streptomyces griseorubiginosus]WUB54395.1 AAC(3) family N-acetyltransferase [Streptomyces griseorubiginosus]